MNDEYLERKKIYAEFGYDIEKERDFVIEAGLPFSGEILEAGTGKGNFSILLAKRGYKFISFDISKEAQSIAKNNISDLGLQDFVDLRIENGECLSFKDKSFDTIFSVNTLHHIENPYLFMDELIRVLSGDGKIILSDFTDHGFDMLDKIHGSRGERHEKSSFVLDDAQVYFKDKDFNTSRKNTKFQDVLLIWKI